MNLSTIIETPSQQPHNDLPPAVQQVSDPLTATFLILFGLSEVIALTPLKANSVVQLLLNWLNVFKFSRKEDETVAQLRQEIEDVTAQLQNVQKLVKQQRKEPTPKPTTVARRRSS